jgi:hypothetical protein
VEKGQSSLQMLDDVTAALRDLIYNRRHYRHSILLLVQSNNAAQLSIQKTLSHFLMYKPRNKKESTAIFEEWIAMERTEAKALMRYVFDRPHAFLLADTGTGELHKNFDRIAMHCGVLENVEKYNALVHALIDTSVIETQLVLGGLISEGYFLAVNGGISRAFCPPCPACRGRYNRSTSR